MLFDICSFRDQAEHKTKQNKKKPTQAVSPQMLTEQALKLDDDQTSGSEGFLSIYCSKTVILVPTVRKQSQI